MRARPQGQAQQKQQTQLQKRRETGQAWSKLGLAHASPLLMHVVLDALPGWLATIRGCAQELVKHIPSARTFCTARDMVNSIGVPKMPGAMVMLRMPLRARSRAIGSVMPTTLPLLAAYAAWPIWPPQAATLAVLISTPRSPVGLGV